MLTLNADIENLLNQYGEEIRLAIKKRLEGDNKVATGKAANTLIKKVTPNSLTIEGWKYIEVISGGREPGKKAPPVGKIMEWIDVKKGINVKSGRKKSLAFIIAKRIGERGIKGNNMLTEIKNQFAPRIDQDLADIIQEEITRIAEETNKKTSK
jgi:hypothetical protein